MSLNQIRAAAVCMILLITGTNICAQQSDQGLAQSKVQWVLFNGSIPANAVVGGTENGQPMYVGRVSFEGGMHPGKIISGGFCNIGWGGKEYSFNEGFEILTAPANSVTWVEYHGSVPSNAILGGYNDPGQVEPLYIAKHAYKGGEHCGKLWANACNIGWGGAEVVLNQKIYILAAVTSPKTNIALGKSASQSSRSQYSKANDAQGAVDGVKNGGFGFHTLDEPNPWWQVDLGASFLVDNIVLSNREDCCSERARTVKVLLSSDGVNFQKIYTHNGSIFGGVVSGKPLSVPINGMTARYVRLQLAEKNALHLDEVEVYGNPVPSQVQWVAYNGSIPANAVVGGSENGQPMLYVGRVSFQGGLHPGKVLPGGGGICNIGWGGKEYSFNKGFEILTAPANTVTWVAYDGSLPANAILGGYNDAAKLEPLYIAKHAYKGGEHCGKLWANACNIGWGGAEIVLKEKIFILVAQTSTVVTQPAVIKTAKTGGASVRTTNVSYFPGQSITVEYSGFPGSSSAWITIVPKGKADTEWGDYQYAREKSGKLEYDLPFLQPGEYEVRGYFDSFDTKVQARYAFTVESGGQ